LARSKDPAFAFWRRALLAVFPVCPFDGTAQLDMALELTPIPRIENFNPFYRS